jgi:site-specific DNA recombinase
MVSIKPGTRQASGRWKGGRRPFGYDADGITVRESEAAEIVRATEDLLAGMSLRAIARNWNERGVTTSTGGSWKPTEVRKLLARPRNAGKMEHRGEIIGDAQWPAIVPEDRWQAVRALVAEESRRTTTGNARRWLGGGLFICGVCGATLRASTTGTGGKGRGHVAAYRCEQRLGGAAGHVARRCSELDAYIDAVAVERLSRPDLCDLARPAGIDSAHLHVERLTLQARLDELTDLHSAGQITGQQMVRGTATVRAALDELDRQLSQAAGASALDGVTGAGAADIWPTLDLSRRRAILDVLFEAIVVHPAPRGRPAGWRPGRSYFDPRAVEITPRQSEPTAADEVAA